ncbi:glycosyltransferase [Francisella salimarina]|uniref:glycosyltransferase n=1 Tax=Francisella salimarina TaxID=2599927 RepID=UPI003D81876F
MVLIKGYEKKTFKNKSQLNSKKKLHQESKQYNSEVIRINILELLSNQASFEVIEKYLSEQIKQFPKQKVNIMGEAFSMLKDSYTKEVLPYGEEYLKANPNNENYKKVLAARYRGLGNIKRSNQLLGIKEYDKQDLCSRLKQYVEAKASFEVIEKYLSEQIKQFPKQKVNIMGEAFSMLKDSYTKEVLLYGEEYLKANPNNENYKKVLAARYRGLGNIKRSNQLLGIKEYDKQDLCSRLKQYVEAKASFEVIEKYLFEQIKQFPKQKVNIMGEAFSMLKDSYTKEVLLYGEEYLKANPNNENYKKDFAIKCIEVGDKSRLSIALGFAIDINNLKGELKAFRDENEKLKLNFHGMVARNEKLKSEIAKANQLPELIREHLSYRWGSRLVNITKSPLSIFTLPYFLYADYKFFKKNRRKNQKNNNPNVVKKTKRVRDLSVLKDLKVAAIMDEFTYNSYKHECDLLQLSPESWQKEIKDFKPDLLFIESAWQGKDSLWKQKVSNCVDELVDLVQYCHSNNIVSMFWNKEDPVHFDTFLPVAKIVDLVFTTDIDCVPRYKYFVEHDDVFFLPFAAQPYQNNPIEKYQRKDAVNFAGSYYLKYPERQRDFESLTTAVSQSKTVEIYDRNYDNDIRDYQFPDKYHSMILGKLPFERIDEAYKGYKYSINMNTIKQSQSMFARRVFELLASNTVVVSNFSRGVRLLFGDLVLCTDNTQEMAQRFAKVDQNDLYYKKFRLQGLRKVISEHTYEDRLRYICSKAFNMPSESSISVVLVSKVASKEEFNSVLESYDRQKYAHRKLYILCSTNYECETEGVVVLTNKKKLIESVSAQRDVSFVGFISPNDYYGSGYLEDLILANKYSNAPAFGKSSYYSYVDGGCKLINSGCEYKHVDQINLNSSIIRVGNVNKDLIKSYFKGNLTLNIPNALSLDKFNYCHNGVAADSESLSKYIDDLDVADIGVKFRGELEDLSSALKPKAPRELSDEDLPKISSNDLFKLIPQPKSSKVQLSMVGNRLKIVTKLGVGNHTYLYAGKYFTRSEMNMELQSMFALKSESNAEDFRTVFAFHDKDKNKISHSMSKAGESHALAIPNDCVYIRFGIKLVGNGISYIDKLVLGKHQELPSMLVAKSKKLVLTKQYPSYDDIYKYGFLHSRVRAYRQSGMLVDIFRINNQPQSPYREFENSDVVTGDAKLLEDTLATGQYDHVLVHLVDKQMWQVLEKYIDKIRVTIWVHGAEIQVWQQRDFDLVGLPKEEFERQKRLSNNRVAFWKNLLSKNYQNLHYVFVSKWLLESSEQYIGQKFPREKVSVVHNNVDENTFDYVEKTVTDRLKIMSIRPYAKKVYANDLTVKAILILSKKSFFNDLEFTIVGDGDLWEETVAPLKQFDNVKLVNKFLQHRDIASLHKQNGVILVPTRMDTQGVSRDEAMSSGLVPITTNVAAIPEFVDASCGMVVEPENPQALANAIEYLYNNPEKFLDLSKAAAARVRWQCNHKNTIQRELSMICVI